MNANKEIMDSIVAAVEQFMAAGYSDNIDVAIEHALHAEVRFHTAKGGNTWQQTTGARWGVTADKVKAALATIRK